MKTVGIRAIPKNKLILPGDWRRILKSEEAKGRGESIAEHGLIHEPLVRKVEGGKYQIIAGRRRIAGMIRQKMEKIPCKVVTCTDDEAVDLEEIENIERWHNPTEQALLLKRRMERLTGKGVKSGKSPKKAKSDAIQQVAKEKGVRPESVSQALWRQKQAEQETPSHPIETWGLDMSEDGEWLAGVKEVQSAVKEARDRVKYAQSLMARVRNSTTAPIGEGTCDRLRDSLSDMAAQLDAQIPTSICPYCKMIPEVMEKCSGCLSQGWMGSVENVPPELTTDSPCVVAFGGELVPYEDFWEEEE